MRQSRSKRVSQSVGRSRSGEKKTLRNMVGITQTLSFIIYIGHYSIHLHIQSGKGLIGLGNGIGLIRVLDWAWCIELSDRSRNVYRQGMNRRTDEQANE